MFVNLEAWKRETAPVEGDGVGVKVVRAL